MFELMKCDEKGRNESEKKASRNDELELLLVHVNIDCRLFSSLLIKQYFPKYLRKR